MKSKLKKSLSLLLALVMCMSVMSVGAFAEGESPTVTFRLTDDVGKMQLPSRDSSVYTDVTGAWNNGVNDLDNQIIAFTQTVTSGGTATKPTKVPRYQIGITQPNNGSSTTFTAEMRNAYTFDGWATADGELYDFSTQVTENLTLYPRFSATGATITISNEAELRKFAQEVELGRIFCLDDEFRSQVTEPRQTVQLTGNIALTNDWTPIASTFRGIFDGNNKTISGLEIDSTGNDVGFFKSTGTAAVVKDLTFAAPTVSSTGEYVGVLAGKATKNTQVSNVNITGAFSVIGQNNVGALFGRANDGVQIANCDITGSSATVTANGSDGRPVGGLLGDTNGAVSVTKCSVSGVTVTGHRKIGGLIGQQNGGALTCTDVSVSSVTLHTNAYTDYSEKLTMGGLVGIFAGNYSNSSMTGTVSSVTMTGPASIANSVYIMGLVSGGTGGTVEAAKSAMTDKITFNVTVSGTNSCTVRDNCDYQGIYCLAAAPAVTNVAQIGETSYDTVEAAVADVTENAEITVNEATTIAGVEVAEGSTVTVTVTDTAAAGTNDSVTAKEVTIATDSENTKAFIVSKGDAIAALAERVITKHESVKKTANEAENATKVSEYVNIAQVLANAVEEKSIDVSSITSMELSLKKTKENTLPAAVTTAMAQANQTNNVAFEVHPIATVKTTVGTTTTETTYNVSNEELAANASFTFKLTGLIAGKSYTLYHYSSEGGLKDTFYKTANANGEVTLTLSSFSYIVGEEIANPETINAVYMSNLSLKESLNLNFYIKLADGVDKSNAVAKVTFNGITTEHPLSDASTVTLYGNTTYKVSQTVVARMMFKTAVLELYVNGEKVPLAKYTGETTAEYVGTAYTDSVDAFLTRYASQYANDSLAVDLANATRAYGTAARAKLTDN